MNFLRDDPSVVYLIIDTETEGLSLIGKNRPWNCSWILYQNSKILEQYDKFVWWKDLNISKGAAQVTRFDYDDYKSKAEDASKILDEFETYLNNKSYVCICHNISSFDCYIIKNWREALNRKNDYSYLDRTIDTNSLARAIKKGVKKIERKDWKLMNFRFSNYVERGLKTNLTALGKEYGIEHDYEGTHRGQSDIILNAKVWNKLRFQIEI